VPPLVLVVPPLVLVVPVVEPDVVPEEVLVVEPEVVPEVVPLVVPEVVLGVTSSSSSQAVKAAADEHNSAPASRESHLFFILVGKEIKEENVGNEPRLVLVYTAHGEGIYPESCLGNTRFHIAY
jgi:hypothetical protein